MRGEPLMITTTMPPPAPGATHPDAERELFRALVGASPAETLRIYGLLVAKNTGLVRWLAERYGSLGAEREELRQVAYLGLMLAIGRFDPERGVPFAVFARPTIEGELKRYFRDGRRWIRLPRRLQETKAALAWAREDLVHSLGRWPTTGELAVRLEVDEEVVREALAADDTFLLRSLDEAVGSGEDTYLADLLGELDPHLDRVVDTHALRSSVATLPECDRELLRLRFYADWTQRQIGERFGVSQMQISRRLKHTLDQLRSQLEAE
jgi:RNA polymerase sigma-B factor